MYDTSHIKFLNSTEILMFREAQEFLHQDAEDIRFRTYDLLFTCYPDLRNKLPNDRYSHPDIVAILFNTKDDVTTGIKALQYLLGRLPQHSEKEYIDNVSLIKQCFVKSLRDVLFDDLTPELMRLYSKIIEQRMLDLIRVNSLGYHGKKHGINLQSAAS